jgi:hypothetical protein
LPGEVVVVVVGVGTVTRVVLLLKLVAPSKFSFMQNAKPFKSWQDESRIGF